MFDDSMINKNNCYFYSANASSYYVNLLIIKYDFNFFVGYNLSKASEKNIDEIIKIVAEKTNSEIIEIKSLDSASVVVYKQKNTLPYEVENDHFIVSFDFYDMDGNVKVKRFQLMVYTHYSSIKQLSKTINEIDFSENEHTVPFISWVVKTNNGLNFQNFKISNNKLIKDSYYPWLKDGVNDFYNKYENSDSPILIVLGPPGTGKTSFIRNYIYKYNKKCMVSYDNRLLTSDDFFLYFLQSDHNLLLLEDHDVFLQDREESTNSLENSIMNKFLNLSEGIFDISDKKIIFTANIDKNKIDSALIRPGRCFDVLEFRPYTTEEAIQVVKDAELSVPTLLYNGSTLAELFHNKKSLHKTKKIGF